LKKYSKPTIFTEKSFETSALACGKTATPPAGSHHFASAYDTFTGHLGSGFGASESVTPGQAGVGFGPGGTSQSFSYVGLCGSWVTLVS
jgi:hypothetical protein